MPRPVPSGFDSRARVAVAVWPVTAVVVPPSRCVTAPRLFAHRSLTPVHCYRALSRYSDLSNNQLTALEAGAFTFLTSLTTL